MRIIHCCLSCFYIDGFTYQENILVREHVKLGHDVLVLASTETFGENNNLIYVEPSEYIGTDGSKVIRLPYEKYLPHKIMKKFRKHPNVYELIDKFEPDIIIFHGLCGWELFTVSRYIKNNSRVKLYVDSHEDFNNSAKNLISYYFLHKMYYKSIINLSKKYINKILYITSETKSFCKKIYKLEDNILEYFPLGGNILSDNEYLVIRNNLRESLNASPEDIIFLQTGKFDHLKKLIESVKAFLKTKRNDFKYVIAGALTEELRKELNELIMLDSRISYIGWLDANQLQKFLCAADVYVQPGSQSSTMQMSLCARCAIILADVPSHRDIFNNNGWLVKTNDELNTAFSLIEKDSNQLNVMSNKSFEFAKKYLDYSKLAQRILD